MARPWDGLSPRETVRLQEALLRDFVRRYLYPFSPIYRRLFDEAGVKPTDIRGLQDLQKLPLTSPATFRSEDDPARPFEAILRPDRKRLRSWQHRSLLRRVAREKLIRGEDAAARLLVEEFKPLIIQPPLAGGPVTAFTMRDLVAMSQAGARAFAVMGLERSDILVSTLPYGGELSHWFTYYAGQAAGMSSLHLGGGQAVRPAQAATWMARVAATVLATQPGYAEGMLRAAPPAAVSKLRVLALWGGPGMAGARARLTSLLQQGGAASGRATTMLGLHEARTGWAECPAPPGQPEQSYGYHTYPDLEVVEVVDPATGRWVGENEPGELVYTSLDWRGSALLRYRTGLLARQGMTRRPCQGCGRTVPRIGPDISRTDWQVAVATPAGPAQVDLADVARVLWGSADVPLWQVDALRGGARGGGDAITAYVAGGESDSASRLQRELTPFRVRVRVTPFQDLRRRIGAGLERIESRVVVRSTT